MSGTAVLGGRGVSGTVGLPLSLCRLTDQGWFSLCFGSLGYLSVSPIPLSLSFSKSLCHEVVFRIKGGRNAKLNCLKPAAVEFVFSGP